MSELKIPIAQRKGSFMYRDTLIIEIPSRKRAVSESKSQDLKLPADSSILKSPRGEDQKDWNNGLVKELKLNTDQHGLLRVRRKSDDSLISSLLNKSQKSTPKFSRHSSQYLNRDKQGSEPRRFSKLDMFDGISRRSSKSYNAPVVKMSKEYQIFYKCFKILHKIPKVDSSSEFQELNDELDQIMKIPNSQTSNLIQICDKNSYEKLEFYDESGCCGKFKKKLLRSMMTVSVFCHTIVTNSAFDSICLIVIFCNCIILALKDPLSTDPTWMVIIDDVFLGFYTVEMVLKIWGLGFVMQRKSYLRDPWNVLDFVVVITGYIALVFNSNSVNLKSLRTVRVLRPLRTISSIKSLRAIVNTLIKALPLLVNSLFILFFVLLVFAIAGLQLFAGFLKRRCFDPVDGRIFIDNLGNDMICGAKSCPSGYICGKMTYNPDNELSNFDTLANALLIVFQIVTLGGWSEIMYETMKAFTPISVIYFLLLVFMGAYFLLNITLAALKISFSTYSHDKNSKSELNYDQKRKKMLEKAKLDILNELKKHRKDRHIAGSTKYLIKLGGKLEKEEPKTEFYFKKYGRIIIESAPIKKILTVVKRFITKLHRSPQTLQTVGVPATEVGPNIFSIDSARKEFLHPPNDSELRVSTPAAHSDRENLLKEENHSISNLKDGAASKRSISPSIRLSRNRVPSSFLESPMISKNKSRIEESKGTDKKPFPIISIAVPIKEYPNPMKPIRPNFISSLNGTSGNKKLSMIGIAGINKENAQSNEANIDAEFFEESEENTKNDRGLFERGLLKKVNNLTGNLVLPATKNKRNLHEKELLKEELGIKDELTFKVSSLDSNSHLNIERKSSQFGTQVSLTGTFIESIVKWEKKTTTNRLETRRFSKQRGSSTNLRQPFATMSDQKLAEVRISGENEDIDDNEIQLNDLNREKYEIDIRFLKAMPDRKKNYVSQSLESVLPKIFQRQREIINKKRLEKIGSTKVHMHYPMLKDGKSQKNVDNVESNFISSQTSNAIPIRKKLRTNTSGKKVLGNERAENSIAKTLFQKTKPLGFDRSNRKRDSSNNINQNEFKGLNNKKNLAGHQRQRSNRNSNIGSRKVSLQPQKSIEVSHNSSLNHEEDQNREQEGKRKLKTTKSLKAQHTLQTDSEKTGSESLKPYLINEMKLSYKDIQTQIRETVEENQKKAFFEELETFKVEEDYMKIREVELKKKIINTNNFSLSDVIRYGFIVPEINAVRRSMMHRAIEYDIWRPGALGLIRASKNKIRRFATSKLLGNFILLIVILNTLTLALDGVWISDTITNLFTTANLAFIIIFSIEMGLKLIGLGPIGYARDILNLFDAMIVIISVLEEIIISNNGTEAISAFSSTRVLRAFRVLRVTRLLRALSFMKVIIGVISRSLKSFVAVIVLISLMLLIYILLGMQLLGGNLNHLASRSNFDSFFQALLSAYQVMIAANWNEILRSVFYSSSMNKWVGSIYLISWVILGNWILLNLLLAIILDEFTSSESKRDQKEAKEEINNDGYYDSFFSSIDGSVNNNESNTSILSHQKTGSINTIPGTNSSMHNSVRSAKLKSFPNNQNKNIERLSSYHSSFYDEAEAKSKVKPIFDGVQCEDSIFIFIKTNSIRILCYKIVTFRHFESVVMSVIMVSSLTLAIETYFTQTVAALNNLDYFFNIFFCIEMTLKVIALGFGINKGSYLRDYWNQLDFLIVVVSLVDMSLSSMNMPSIKILKMLRTLRPLRFVSHNENMRLVVNSLIKSIPAILNVFIVLCMVWLIFAILGTNLLNGKLGYCDVPNNNSYYGISIIQCLARGYPWKLEIINYDNVGYGLLSIFVLSTIEGYPDYMSLAFDAADQDTGPIKNGFWGISFYYLIFLFIGSLILMQLFTGVIFMKFDENQKEARKKGIGAVLSSAQMKWIEMQRMIVSSKPDLFLTPPENRLRRAAFFLVKEWGDGQYFDFVILAFIIANIATMGMAYEGSSSSYNYSLTEVNYMFTAVFILEAVIKITAVGVRNYWKDPWNKFDIFIIISSSVDIIISVIGTSFSFLRIGPQLVRVVRVLRVTRVFKLIRNLKRIQKILWVLYLSMPAILNLLTLLFLVFFIFSILAVFLFQNIIQGVVIDPEYVNFKNFGIALLTLFRCSTDEDWYKIMYDTWNPVLCSDGTQNCGQPFAIVFWIAFMMTVQYIIVNMLVSVMIQEFDNYYFGDEELSIDKFQENMRNFVSVWAKLAKKSDGVKMKSKTLMALYANLKKPLGFSDFDMPPNLKQRQIAKHIMKLKIKCDFEDCVYFNDVLFATLKNTYEKFITKDADHAVLEFVRHEETKTLKIIEKSQHIVRKKPRRDSGIIIEPTFGSYNPMFAFLYFKMGYKAWINYALLKQEKQKECEEKGIPYENSESEESDSDFSSSDYSDDDDESDDYERGMEEIPEGNSDESDSEEEEAENQSRQSERSMDISIQPSQGQQIRLETDNDINHLDRSSI